ncbi:DgyrCDS10662 [Dimorphilus gyrociliatus]|uniref:Small ribosomal subunit protein mS33 n=1 Tax=Dimorphilus gyrociliatus TaxID=2664684 RepID=A0A7I8W0V8_9ANNE|nr:DgyrCDS10662 [Dimorphilus gyrociliatus]
MALSNYARRMAKLSSRIFSEASVPVNMKKNADVVNTFQAQPHNHNRAITDYYPRHVEITSLFKKLRFLGLYRDEHQDFADEMKRLRALRGKVKPKKGEGKRAVKRKVG